MAATAPAPGEMLMAQAAKKKVNQTVSDMGARQEFEPGTLAGPGL
jgi:hypothetical protein